MESKKVAIILSGCGYLDGTEIRESVLTLLALDILKITYEIFAPNLDQYHTINHKTGEELSNKRNILQESARIARGNIAPLQELDVEQFNGLVIPGGFGVAKNLCDFAFKGSEASVLQEVRRTIEQFYSAKKPIAGICIAPALLALVLGKHSIKITIGADQATAAEIEKTGAQHRDAQVNESVSDNENKVFTTPAYMFDQAPLEKVYQGITVCMQSFSKTL